MKKIITLILCIATVLSCCITSYAVNPQTWEAVKPSNQTILTTCYKLENKIRDMFYSKAGRAESVTISLKRNRLYTEQNLNDFVDVRIKPDKDYYQHITDVDRDYVLTIYKYQSKSLSNQTEVKQIQESHYKKDIIKLEPGKYVIVVQSKGSPKLKAYKTIIVYDDDILYQTGDEELLYGTYSDYTNKGKLYQLDRYILTPYIPVAEGERYTLSFAHSMILYDNNKNFVKGISYKNFPETTGGVKINDYVIPSGINYIRVNFVNDYGYYSICKISNQPYETVILGDSIFGNYFKPYDIPSKIEYQTGMHIANCAIGGSTASDNSGKYKLLEFIHIADAIYSNNFDETIIAAKEALTNGLANVMVVHNAQTFKQVDFSKVKQIIIAYGTNDWNFGYSTLTYKEALEYGIERILSKYPNIQIIICSPIYRQIATNPNSKGVYLSEFAKIAENVANEYGCVFFDHYNNSGINAETYSAYLKDGTHPSDAGIELLANLMTEELLNL